MTDTSDHNDREEPFEIRAGSEFWGDEMPTTIEAVNEDTGETRVIGADPGGDE